MPTHLQREEDWLREKNTTLSKRSTAVVYSIPLSCRKMYIGHPERCLNDRLREHDLKVEKNEDKHAQSLTYVVSCCEEQFRET